MFSASIRAASCHPHQHPPTRTCLLYLWRHFNVRRRVQDVQHGRVRAASPVIRIRKRVHHIPASAKSESTRHSPRTNVNLRLGQVEAADGAQAMHLNRVSARIVVHCCAATVSVC